MNINKILRQSFLFVNKYSLPFKEKLFENLTKNTYNDIFLKNPDRFWTEHSKILDHIIDRIDKNSKILDLWCWNGKDSLWLAKQWMLIDAVDLSEESIKIISTRINEEIKNNIILHQSSIRKYLHNNTKEYNLISCNNSLQFDFDWFSRIKEIQDYTLVWWYNTLSWPLGISWWDWYWNYLNKEKILNLYQDREVIFIEESDYKKWDIDCQRLSFIAQKR